MAMNKAEQKRLEDAERELAIALALSWPSYPYPAPSDKRGTGYGDDGSIVRGYFINTYTARVGHGCRSAVSHSWEGARPTTQGFGKMWDTEAEAYRALRIELTRQYAKQLAELDRKIAELGGNQP